MLKRGFKKKCEDQSIRIRRVFDLTPSDPLDPYLLAEKSKIKVLTPEQIKDLAKEDLNVLLNEDSDGWSAVTLCLGGTYVIILNSSHSDGRSSSDLMHEIAHIIVGHKPSRVDLTEDGLLVLNTYDKSQEQEADWLSGCLLLPRDALLLIRRSRLKAFVAQKIYGVSADMLNFRLNITGVNRQYQRFYNHTYTNQLSTALTK